MQTGLLYIWNSYTNIEIPAHRDKSKPTEVLQPGKSRNMVCLKFLPYSTFYSQFLIGFFYILVTKYIEMFTFSAAKISISTQMIICFLQGIFLLFF